MSENESKDRPKAEVLKVILVMIIFMVVGVIILSYYPIIKNNIESTFTSQSNKPSQTVEELDHGVLNAKMNTFKGVDLQGKEVSVFNYLDNEVYRSDSDYSVEFLDQNSGFIIRDKNNTLKAAFIGDSWYSLEVLPKGPLATDQEAKLPESVTAKGELTNVEK